MPPEPDLRRVFDDLIRFETELWDAVDARLRPEGVTLGRFETLLVIERQGPCRVADIAAALAITVGGVSKLVDRLEAGGHCRRRPNPDDRRSSLVELTPAGRELLARAGRPFDDELRARLGAVLPAGDLERLAATLATLRAAASATTPSRSPTP
jgi:DNA-binding MarR family transcriptional regulator